MFPHEFRRVLEEQAKEAVEAPPPADVKASPFGAGHENVPEEKPSSALAQVNGVESDSNSDLDNEYKEDMINPIADEDPNRKEVNLPVVILRLPPES